MTEQKLTTFEYNSAPSILKSNIRMKGCDWIQDYRFDDGFTVPVFDVSDVYSFTQIIGQAKFINNTYGKVYYRGVDNLYPNVLPAIVRESNRKTTSVDCLIQVLKNIRNREVLKNSLKVLFTNYSEAEKESEYRKRYRFDNYRLEGLLQHYAGITRMLDVVDNHWVALWMSIHEFKKHGKANSFVECRKRTYTPEAIYENITQGLGPLNIYAYIILIAMPNPVEPPFMGVTETQDFVEVDLRQALPSHYLRPHAQHALVIGKRVLQEDYLKIDKFNLTSQVVGILRVRLDRAFSWISDGDILTKDALFPSPGYDLGFASLLINSDLFTHAFKICQY